MKIFIRSSVAFRHLIFIIIEALLCIGLIHLSHKFKATSNITWDIFVGSLYLFMASILPVWIIGFVHLWSIGLLKNYERACMISLGVTFTFLFLSILWSDLFKIVFYAPIITFNIVGWIRIKF